GIRDFHVTGVQTCALPICPIAVFDQIQFACQPHSLRRRNGLLELPQTADVALSNDQAIRLRVTARKVEFYVVDALLEDPLELREELDHLGIDETLTRIVESSLKCGRQIIVAGEVRFEVWKQI